MDTSTLTSFRNKLIRNGDLQPKVLFDNIGDNYSLNENVACEYSLLDYDAKPEDRILLFKSGWTSLKDYIVFKWAVYGKGRQRLAVIFERHSLPQDPNEFYQFCYVTDGNTLCGASKVFQLSNSSPLNISLMSFSSGNSGNFESHCNVSHKYEDSKCVRNNEGDKEQGRKDSRERETVQKEEVCSCKCKSEIMNLKSLIVQQLEAQSVTNKHMEDIKKSLNDVKKECEGLQENVKSLEEKCRSLQERHTNSCVSSQMVIQNGEENVDVDILLEIENLPPLPELNLPFIENLNVN